jgi:hypothetical protein
MCGVEVAVVDTKRSGAVVAHLSRYCRRKAMEAMVARSKVQG